MSCICGYDPKLPTEVLHTFTKEWGYVTDYWHIWFDDEGIEWGYVCREYQPPVSVSIEEGPQSERMG